MLVFFDISFFPDRLFTFLVVIPPLLRRCFVSGFIAAATLLSSGGDATALTVTTIHTFTAASEGNVTYPPLVQGADGRLYGVNSTGGRADLGTIFSLGLGGGSFDTLNVFTGTDKGSTPEGGIVQARDGNFYGTTNAGGSNGYGTLYQMVPSTGKINILAQFDNTDPGGNPVGTLTEGVDGLLYGTARYGGANNYGTVFHSGLAAGTLTTLAGITGGLAGYYPQSDLIQATDGNFYGTTEQGGTYSLGTFFQVTPAGVYTTLYSFTGGADGGRPLRGVVQGIDGLFYGVCNTGGTYGGGAIFRIAYLNTTFSLTSLYSFIPAVLDGSNALGNLVQASDGNFYGTTSGGGLNGDGTIYRVTPTGGYDVIYSFTDGTDGSAPVAGLTQASDGKLYGTTAGKNSEAGTVFRLDAGLPAPIPRAKFLLQSNASVGDTILIKGDNFVGATAVSFVGAGGTLVASGSFAVLSKTVVQAVVPDGAVTGPVTVTANGLSGTTPVSLVVAAVPVTPTKSTVTITAAAPLASKADSTEGKFKVVRANGDNSTALTVNYKVRPKSTAILHTDYNLISKGKALGLIGSVTIQPGKSSVAIKVIPVPGATVSAATTVVIKLTAGDGYSTGTPIKGTVQIVSSPAGP